MSQRILFIPLLLALLAGCAVGPDYVPPETALPDQFIGKAALDRRRAAVDAEMVAWWSAFGDARLARYVDLALTRNLDLAQASARVAQTMAPLPAASPEALTTSGSAWRST